MARTPERPRRETAEAPVGIGGLSPHPARGPSTAFRVLGRGIEIPVDADRAGQRPGIVGDCFTFQGVRVLALDELTHKLVPALTAYCGIGADNDVDSALAAILWRRPIILCGSRSDDVVEFARTIHEHSIRRSFPFTQVDHVPNSDGEIEALCTEAGCGTVFLDLTTPLNLPRTLVRHLFCDHFHLWTIAVAPVAKDAERCFGPGTELVPFCNLGFRRMPWHRRTLEVRFTQE